MLMMPQSYDARISTIETAQKDDSFMGRVMAWEVAWDYATDHFPMGNGFSGSELPQVFNHYLPKEATHAAHSIFFEVLGDTGFAGLAIYLVVMASTFVNCTRTKRLARGQPELEWAYDLADMVQLSLFAFCLGGSALSLAYYDVFFIWVGLSQALYLLVSRQALQGAKVKRGRFERVPGSERVSYAKQQALPVRE
jgi:probable O-glycosylation ligase (exosortase A-associated)